ncbi:hypothetical protein [Streptomyces sp. NPDC046939]
MDEVTDDEVSDGEVTYDEAADEVAVVVAHEAMSLAPVPTPD